MISYNVNDDSSCHMDPKNPHPVGHGTECCCICKYQIEVFSHPWIDKKPMSNSTGIYVCIVGHNLEENNRGMISHKHGGCEMFDKKEI
jgi:hypothetical protein